MAKIFFSYSHHDERDRDLLETHLTALRREGVIETWHDRRILAGHDWDGEISEHLENADIILLLISPYFIASDYCFNLEMNRAMERHEAGEAVVIPIIIEYCDWQKLPFGRLQAIPTDGKPISKFPNKHEGFAEVATHIRNVVESVFGPKPSSASERSKDRAIRQEIRSSNLRTKIVFTDQERDQFLSDAFEYISKYFENSLKELQQRNPQVSGQLRRIDANRFHALLYRHGKLQNQCAIRLEGHHAGGFGIVYGNDLNQNSYNEALSITDDGYSLFLKSAFGAGMMTDREKSRWNFEGAAEYLWTNFIQNLQ